MSGEKKRWYEQPVFLVIGIVASCLTIFGFVTSLFSLRDLYSLFVDSPSPSPTRTNPEVPNNQELDLTTPTVSLQTVSPTSLPIKNYETATVVMSQLPFASGLGTVNVRWVSAGDVQLENFEITVSEVIIDIRGTPVADSRVGQSRGTTDRNGEIQFDDLPPGDYAMILDDDGHSAMGAWGEQGEYNGRSREMIIFPVEAGMQTEIVVILSLLEIEVWNLSGSKVFKDEHLYLMCEDRDIAGNLIPSDRCNGEVLWEYDYPTGVAQFHVGPGTYFLRPRHFWQVGDPVFADQLIVGAGEVIRTSVNLPYD
ncbi:MAG: hypothetical protein KDE09_12615 [Anaerolineales bacterium]|nr:hypothetical protein [Anaerolineales bacterium]